MSIDKNYSICFAVRTMARKSKEPRPIQPQKFAVGETVLINRPHLWSGCVGEVVKFENGLHRIRIVGKCDAGEKPPVFHTDAEGEFLEGWI